MDNTRVTRTRAKSSANETPASGSDAEMAPNLNGNKDGGNDNENVIAPTTDAESPTESEAVKEGSTRSTRKRKLTETKTEDEENEDIQEDTESAANTKDESKPKASNDDVTDGAVDETSNKTDLPAEPEPEAMETSNPAVEQETPDPVVAAPALVVADSAPVVADSAPVVADSAPVVADSPPVSSAPGIKNIATTPVAADLQTINTGTEIYGKGKRARVPNKRYSDIIHSLTRSTKIDSPRSAKKPAPLPAPSKNGDFPEDDLGEILREELEQKEFNTPRKALNSKKLRSSVDLANPCYRKPFKYGWKRELVHRGTLHAGKAHGDIYYITPTGQKVRSMREVAENLRNRELSLEDFTFFKEPLGINDPEKEIIRSAKKAGVTALEMNRKMTSKLITKSKKRASSSPAPSAKGGKSAKSSSFKVKAPKGGSSSAKKEKKDVSETTDEGMLPPNWNYPKKGKGKKVAEPVKSTSRQSSRTRDAEENQALPKAGSGPPNFMGTYMQNLQYGYKTLFCVFQYLKVQDLLRAGCVCTMWRDMSRYPLLWRTVRMKNSQIHSFEGLANALQQHGTVHLDLRKMLLPSNTTNDDIWPSFTSAIKKVESLRRIELCRCLASVVEDLARNNHNLEVINAVTIKCESMTFEPFENLTNLVDLRLKSTAGLTLSSDLSALKSLTKLKHLSITSIKDLNKLNIEVISELVNLEVLDLGECSDFPKHFGPDIVSKLIKLEKLRLEKGQGECHTFDILEAIKDLNELQQLELVNFDIKTGFDKALGACYNIKKLLIIPTYISQSATTNHMVLGGVLRLQKTLSHFVWGVTLELLRVTELFVDQCEQPDKKEPREKGVNSGDSIPVLKPVPLHGIQQPEVTSTNDTPQVEILPLPNLQKLLLQNLPTTRVKILKIPFHATWRQSITDSVN